MNIAIFEPEHFETVLALVLLFNPERNRITIFTNQTCYTQLMLSQDHRFKKCHWIVKAPAESKYGYLLRFYNEVGRRKTELLLLNTVNSNFIFHAVMIRLLKGVRVVLGVHDINSYFRYKPAFSIRRWVRNFGKKCLVAYMKEFSVTSTTLADYLKTMVPPSAKVHCIPGAIYEAPLQERVQPRPGSGVTLVVAGTIDSRRRDYELVFQLLEKAAARSLPLSVVLLGGPSGVYGQQIIEKCRAYSRTNKNLKFYDTSLVDQPEFDRVMEKAQFVFIPSVISTMIFDGIEETYGVSKSSGNLSDVIKHAKPFIIPKALHVDLYLENSCIRYTNLEDVVAELQLMHHSPERYLLLQEQATAASQKYTVERVRARNPGLFEIHV